jgi:hypothetical protein
MIHTVPEVPTLTSIALVPPINLAYPAVPDADAVADQVPCFAIDPPEAAAQGEAGSVIVARSVPEAAVFADAGCVPVLISTVLPAGNLVAISFARSFRISVSNRVAIVLFFLSWCG